MGKTAGIVIIGNEILSGKIQDTNSPYLCIQLRDLGVEVKRVSVIPDEVEVIAQEVAICSSQHDLVFTTGGVGPTHDDVSIEGIAKGLGQRVVRLPELESYLRHYYGERLNAVHLKMTEVPEGATLIADDGLLFPVIVVKNIYIFPGIPQILRLKFEVIKERFRDAPFFLKKVFLKVGEGVIAQPLRQVMDAYPALLLGSYPQLAPTDYQVMVTMESKDQAYLQQAFTALLAQLPQGSIHHLE